MRNLGQYLPSFKKEKYLRGRSGHDTESESVTIEAIERAIKAEAEVERLKLMVKSITSGLDEAIETNHYLENELVKYNLAFKLACKSLDETQKNYLTPGGWSLETTFLKQAEIELENG